MENETLKNKHPIRKNYQPLRTLLYDYSLPLLSEKIKQGHNCIIGWLDVINHIKLPDKLMLFSALNKKTEIVFFKSQDSIAFKIVEGKLKFQTQNASIILNKGQSLTIDKKLKHRMKTKHQMGPHQIITFGKLQPTVV